MDSNTRLAQRRYRLQQVLPERALRSDLLWGELLCTALAGQVIATGLDPSLDDGDAVHKVIRAGIAELRPLLTDDQEAAVAVFLAVTPDYPPRISFDDPSVKTEELVASFRALSPAQRREAAEYMVALMASIDAGALAEPDTKH